MLPSGVAPRDSTSLQLLASALALGVLEPEDIGPFSPGESDADALLERLRGAGRLPESALPALRALIGAPSEDATRRFAAPTPPPSEDATKLSGDAAWATSSADPSATRPYSLAEFAAQRRAEDEAEEQRTRRVDARELWLARLDPGAREQIEAAALARQALRYVTHERLPELLALAAAGRVALERLLDEHPLLDAGRPAALRAALGGLRWVCPGCLAVLDGPTCFACRGR